VRLIGRDGNAFALIGEVARVLRRQVSPEAAAESVDKATAQRSYDALLTLIQSTVIITSVDDEEETP
jgi:hypothetical protein